MARINLITARDQTTSDAQRNIYDYIVASRGKMIRPFEVLMHTPALATPLSELGAKIRFGGTIADHDRELVILTAAIAHGCQFEWDSHHPIAVKAGVRAEALAHLQGSSDELTEHEDLVITYVRTLISNSTVPAELFSRALDTFGEAGIIELTVTVGYYTLLAYTMGAVDAC